MDSSTNGQALAVSAIDRTAQALRKPDRPFELGYIVPEQTPFELAWKHLSVHMAILGGSGSGKSKFLELLMRQLMLDEQGFCFIDPHGDTARDLLAFAAALKAEGDDRLWRKIHYVRIGPQLAVSYDPFAKMPLRSMVSRVEYYAALRTKVNRVCRSMLRRVADADLDVMNRLKKWLKSILYACGVAIDDQNTHLGLSKMLAFTDPHDPEFAPLLEQVWEHLPRWVQNNFRTLRETKSEQVRDKLESTINRLTDILSELVEEVFAQRAPSINVGQIIAEGGFLIVDMGETMHWDFDQKVTFGGLLIDEVLLYKQAEENLPRSLRKRFVLIIDESGEFLGEDLQRALGATRKFELPIILAAQDLTTFARGDLDLAPKVLSQCGTVVCFQQTFRPDKEVLADRLGAGDTRLTKILQECQRQRGWIERQMEEHSYGTQQGENWSNGGSRSVGESENEVISEMIAVMQGYARSHGSTRGEHHTDSQGDGDTSGAGQARGLSPIIVGGKVVGMVPTVSGSSNEGHSRHRGSADGTSKTEMESEVDSRAVTHATGTAHGKGKNRQRGRNWSNGGQQSESHTVARKTMLLANLESDFEWNGLYAEGSVRDQFEMLMQALHCLSVAEAIVSVRGVRRSMAVTIAPVREWWETEEDKGRAIERLVERLRALRPYYFNPSEDLPETASESATTGNANGHTPQKKRIAD